MKLITRIVLLATVLVLPALASAGTYVSITVAPPPLPVYAQPVCPGDGYIWTPGYWAWDGDEYYWVPGTWVLAPAVDVFWTPGYWGWGGGYYAWHAGYWGPHVGFYGGVNYGYGYTGVGYAGGRWEGGRFHYNRAVNNVKVVNIHNTYNTVVVNNNHDRVSFNGGDHGTRARPNAHEMVAQRDHHIGATSLQKQHVQAARDDRSLRFSQNHGNPGHNAATARPISRGSGGKPMMKAPGTATRPAQGHMPSSGFAPHANRGETRNPSPAPQLKGSVNDRADRPHGNALPSSSYGPRERPQTQGRVQTEGRVQPQGPRPQAPRAESPRVGNPGVRGGPVHQQRIGGGAEMRHGGGQRPQAEHHREPR